MDILIIEDEQSLREALFAYLTGEGYVCRTADNLANALNNIHHFPFDCILVDIGLPDGNGLDVVRTIKAQQSEAGIIVITARNAIDDKVAGFTLGADDYLTKPFHLSELHLRIQSILRRRSQKPTSEIRFNEIRVQLTDMSVHIHDRPLSLTRKEYAILVYLISNRNQVIIKEALAEHLLGEDVYMVESLDFLYPHIKNLRRKMLDLGGQDYIRTIYGIGYKFTAG